MRARALVIVALAATHGLTLSGAEDVHDFVSFKEWMPCRGFREGRRRCEGDEVVGSRKCGATWQGRGDGMHATCVVALLDRCQACKGQRREHLLCYAPANVLALSILPLPALSATYIIPER